MNLSIIFFARSFLIILGMGGLVLTIVSVSYSWQQYSHIESIPCFVYSCQINYCQYSYSSTCKSVLFAEVSSQNEEYMFMFVCYED